MRTLFFVLVLLFGSPYVSAQTPQPPIEAYGNLQTISDLAISPSGSHIAYINRNDGINAVVVSNVETGEIWGVEIGDSKVTQVRWAGPDYVIIGAFETARFEGRGERNDYTGAFSLDIKTVSYTHLTLPTKA